MDICYFRYILPICVCGGALSSKNSQHYQQIVRIYERTLPHQRCEGDYIPSGERYGKGYWTFT